jgi:hypothetical protein
MPTDSFSYALERLDPASRALLDLSLRRGMRTEEIADVLGAEPESVEASRDEALQRIASDVGMDELDDVRARLAELPAEEWLGARNGSGPVADEPAPAPVEEKADDPTRRRGVWPLLLGLLLTVGVIVAIALATSGDDDTSSTSSSSSSAGNSAPQPAPAPNASGSAPAKLAAIGGRNASGTAAISGKTLSLQVSGLRPGHYEVWLYNSVLDARSLGKADGRSFKVKAALPGNWKRFRFVDVSRERRDGNLSHSGESVLRVRTKSLR